MRVLLVPDGDRKEHWSLQAMDDEGRATGEPTGTRDLAATVRRLEVDRPRWVWPSTARVYPLLLRAGVRIDRCHDLAMTEALLCAHEERPAPPGSTADVGSSPGNAQASLFDPEIETTTDARSTNVRATDAKVMDARTANPRTTDVRTTNVRTTDERARTNHRTQENHEPRTDDKTQTDDKTRADGKTRADDITGTKNQTVTDENPDLIEDSGADPTRDENHRVPDGGADRRVGSRLDQTHQPDRDAIARLLAEHADQLVRIRQARAISPGFGLLVAAESAAALAAVEMGQVGLPWRADIHDQVLTDLLGERPRHGGRPPRLQELAVAVAEALEGEAGPGRRSGGPRAGGTPGVNVDSPLEVLRAFRRQGVQLESTRAWELRNVDHPAVEPLLRYKELARLHSANGWAWREQWVHDGRFRPEYIVGGVVSGRWATKGGGALQIPKAVRASVVADPGWALVVADAGQLEPRILAALSGDPGMVTATQAGDLYAALATQALGRPEARDETKIALLAAMYGARGNTPAMAALTRRFPKALDLLEAAARVGEDGGIVRSVLGRTCPPPSPDWQQGGSDAVLLNRSRARGRFTRNFVIQASAADWANALVAGLRQRLTALAPDDGHSSTRSPRPELVFFQHDEVVVHTPQAQVDAVIAAITTSGAEATRLVVGDRGVRIPFTATPVASYADKH